MNNEQINEYMQALLSGKQKVEGLLETEALKQFRERTTEIAHGQQRVQQLADEIEKIRNGVQQLIGQRTAYSQMLVAAEVARRPAEVPLSLVELGKKLGANKVEAVDNEGNVVDSSEEEAPLPSPPQARFIKEGAGKAKAPAAEEEN